MLLRDMNRERVHTQFKTTRSITDAMPERYISVSRGQTSQHVLYMPVPGFAVIRANEV